MSALAPAPETADVLLVEFAPRGASPRVLGERLGRIAAELGLAPGSVRACEASAEPRITAYLGDLGSAVGDEALAKIARGHLGPLAAGRIEVSRLRRHLVLSGAAAGEAAPFHYVVRTDVEAGWEAELDRWYDTEHLPGLAAVPGTVLAQRYVSLGDTPRYYACYDLTAADVLDSPPWLAVRGTAWSSRIRPMFRNTRRAMSRVVDIRS